MEREIGQRLAPISKIGEESSAEKDGTITSDKE